MKVIVHHLPTGCKWEVETSFNVKHFADHCFKAGSGLVVGDDQFCVYFPAEVVAQSVIKVIE